MPARWAQATIIVFWLVMTSLLVRRDVLPRLGFGELNYRHVITDRAVSESTHWTILWNDQRLGSSLTIVRPNPDGSYNLLNRTNLSSEIFQQPSEYPETQVLISSDIAVGPLGDLNEFAAKLTVEGTNLKVDLAGVVEGDKLHVETKGFSLLPEKLTLNVHKDMMLLDVVAPLDRIPDLRVGKKWSTQTVNPISLVVSGGLFGERSPSFDIITHEVVGTDAISWQDRSWFCHVIEHTHPSGRSKTWVRARDGRVLRHQVPIGGSILTLEPDDRLTPLE